MTDSKIIPPPVNAVAEVVHNTEYRPHDPMINDAGYAVLLFLGGALLGIGIRQIVHYLRRR